jgi:hypothetical protein
MTYVFKFISIVKEKYEQYKLLREKNITKKRLNKEFKAKKEFYRKRNEMRAYMLGTQPHKTLSQIVEENLKYIHDHQEEFDLK